MALNQLTPKFPKALLFYQNQLEGLNLEVICIIE